jgi:ferric-dicitrate binding protein FerR (iron transport regulator)
MPSETNKKLEEWKRNGSRFLNEQDLEKLWEITDSYKAGYRADIPSEYSRLNARLDSSPSLHKKKVFRTTSRVLLRIAAVIVALLFVFWGAGNLVSLFDSTNVIVTEKGSRKIIELQDGSFVTLNENSTLSYKDSYNDKSRHVHLTGEAYFRIRHLDNHPFLVKTKLGDIKVLGTEFNVRTHEEYERITVFVHSGEVVFQPDDNGRSTYNLTSLDMLDWKKGNSNPKISKDKDGNSAAWYRNKLVFINTPFRDIFKSIESEFGVRFEIQNSAILNCPFTLSIELKRSSLIDAMAAIQAACPLTILEKSENQFTVTGTCCD